MITLYYIQCCASVLKSVDFHLNLCHTVNAVRTNKKAIMDQRQIASSANWKV